MLHCWNGCGQNWAGMGTAPMLVSAKLGDAGCGDAGGHLRDAGGMEEGGCMRSVEGMVGGYWEDAAGMQGYIM